MNDQEWVDRYKAEMREFLAKRGRPVEINPDAEYDFDEVSTYGWGWSEASDHCTKPNEKYPYPGYDGCHWIVPEGAEVTERTYSQFQDTDASNLNEVGLNVYPCSCACGRYKDVTLRFVGTLGDVMAHIVGPEKSRPVITL